MDRLDHADRTGAGAGHRQHHLHFDPGRPVTAETARVRAQDRTVPGDVHAHRAAVPAVVDRRARCALVYAFGSGDFRSRLDLIAGGVFIIWKSTKEIHQLLVGGEDEASSARGATFSAVIIQIAIIDLVFSLDSIITAVGMVDRL